MATALTSWYDDVLVDVNGCLPELALKHIRQAAIKFCQETGAITKDLAPIALVTSQRTYTLTAPLGYDIVDIRHGFIGNNRVYPSSRGQLEEKFGEKIDTLMSTPQFFYQEQADQIVLVPVPTQVDNLVLKACLKPTLNTTTVDDFLFKHHFEAIANGAKATLFEIPKKPWSDIQLSQYHARKFDEAIESHKTLLARGTSHTPMRTKKWM